MIEIHYSKILGKKSIFRKRIYGENDRVASEDSSGNVAETAHGYWNTSIIIDS